MRLGFAGIAENYVEHHMNTRKICLAGGLHHLLYMLETFVHQVQYFLRGRLGAKADVVHATFGEHAHVLFAHGLQEIRGSLEVPLKLGSAIDDSSCDCHCTLSIDEEVGIEERYMLNVVAGDEFSQVVDDPFDMIGVETSFIKYLV